MNDSPRPYPDRYMPAVEAMLFAADDPLTAAVIAEALTATDETVVPEEWARAVLEDLKAAYAAEDRGFTIVEIGGGYEMRTRALFSDYVRHLYKKPPVRLSRAALEVLAVVAYRQPVTRAQVEDIRGVDCSGMLRRLAERELIKVIGKADEVGRPLLYGTSPKFLQFFSLSSLADLPTLKEYTELSDDHLVQLQELDETLAANRADSGHASEAETATQLGVEPTFGSESHDTADDSASTNQVDDTFGLGEETTPVVDMNDE